MRYELFQFYSKGSFLEMPISLQIIYFPLMPISFNKLFISCFSNEIWTISVLFKRKLLGNAYQLQIIYFPLMPIGLQTEYKLLHSY